MPFTSLAHVPVEEQRSPGGRFRSSLQNITVQLGGIRNVGTWGGGHPFDVQLRRLPPGAAVCPFHLHLAQWELFVIRSGTATVRVGTESVRVRAGEVFIHPPGEAHQLRNDGSEDLVVLIVADNPPLDAFYYPDSDKWGLRPPGQFFRVEPVDYFEGEDAGADGQTLNAHVMSGSEPRGKLTLPSGVTPFEQRRVDPELLPWMPWTSPKGKFHGSSKELSVALGAKHNTAVGLGGHPFDLELSRLEAGACGVPFHSHSAQWEMFWILRGEPTVRTPEGTRVLRAGDIVLHPPGEAHQLTNTGSEPCEFYLIADNPLQDVWHYPDAAVWGYRGSKSMLRVVDSEYWHHHE